MEVGKYVYFYKKYVTLLQTCHRKEHKAVFSTIEKDGNMHNYRRRQGKRALTNQQENNMTS